MATFAPADEASTAPTFAGTPSSTGGQPVDLVAVQDPAAPTSRSGLNIGLGFLRGLGLEKKTNRDGQPTKRRGPKPDSKPALTRRQELNRQAQRTHRQRKEVYIKSLEDQVMHLRSLHATEVSDRCLVEEENRKLKELLRIHGITIPGSIQLPPLPSHYGIYPRSSPSESGGQGHGTSDYATPSSYHASGSDYGNQSQGPGSAMSVPTNGSHLHRQQSNPALLDQLVQGNPEENQIGIDFVLALEAFCNDHKQYLCVRSSQSADSPLPVASGHALMLSCPPVSHIENSPSEPYPHKAPALPTASLATLLKSAQQLPWVGDGEVTPIMALNFIHTDPRYGHLLVKEFMRVQEELKEKTRCYGFGAVLEEFEVRDAIENVFARRITEHLP